MNMENLDMHDIACFGFTLPRKDSWYVLLHKITSDGWKAVDESAFEKSLETNIESSYQNMVSMSFVDLDTDQNYLAGFDNTLKQWKLEIPDTPDDAIDKNDKKAFFKSEIFKRTCKRADEILTNAYKSCKNMIMPEVEKGRFIDLDDTKLEAIMDMLDDPQFRKNLKIGKFVH